jgi:type I restriction enzyme S subunit
MGSAGISGYHDTARVRGPGVVVGRSGASFGKVHWSSEDYWPLNTALFARDFCGNDPRFVYLALSTLDFEGFNSGSAQPSLNRNFIARVAINIPGLAEQRAIASVFGALDDKISSNGNLAAHLEDLAARVFRGRFGTLIEGPVPLTETVTVIPGRSYKSSELVDESDVALLSLKSIAAGGGYQAGGLKPYSGSYKAAQVVAPGDVVIAVTDLTQAANVVGRAARVPHQKTFSTLVVSLDVVAIRPPTPAWGSYLMGLFQSRPWLQQAIGYSNGSTVLHLSKQAFAEFLVRQPAEHEVMELAAMCDPLYAKADALRVEAGTLCSIRDALLPKLVSGQIRVPLSDDSAGALGAAVVAHGLLEAQAR